MKVTLKNSNGDVKQEQTRTRTKTGTKDLVVVYIPDEAPPDDSVSPDYPSQSDPTT